MVKKSKRKITKKSFQHLCKEKLDTLKMQICRNELDEIIYNLGICKDENIEYIAIHSYISATTVKRTLKKLYDRVLNLPIDLYEKIFNDTL